MYINLYLPTWRHIPKHIDIVMVADVCTSVLLTYQSFCLDGVISLMSDRF